MREAGVKEKGARKTIRIVPRTPLPKPAWIRVRAPGRDSRFHEIKEILRSQQHRRVLRQGHGHLHDSRRHLHAPLPLL
jgi:lipoate synthase